MNANAIWLPLFANCGKAVDLKSLLRPQRMACCLESRVRVDRFMHLVTRRLGRRHLRAIVIQADRFGAHREVILVTLRSGSFIATPDSTFHWNIWDQLLTAPGNSPA